MGWGTLLVVRDGWEDPQGDPERVGRPSRWSGMGQGIAGEVRDESKDPPRGPGWVG